jgi:hypothetical protein
LKTSVKIFKSQGAALKICQESYGHHYRKPNKYQLPDSLQVGSIHPQGELQLLNSWITAKLSLRLLLNLL